MEECNKSIYFSNTNVTDSNEIYNTQKCDLIPFDIKLDNKLKVKKSQLLSTDDWENYQKEIIRLCFEYWEENETQSHDEVKKNLQSDLEISDSESEIKMPSSLFVTEKNKQRNFDFETKDERNNTMMLDKLHKNKYIEVNNHFLKNKQKDDTGSTGVQRLSKSIIPNVNWKNNVNCSKIVDVENKRTKKKKSKKFSFYKHMSKQTKPKNKLQSFTIDRSTTTSCTLDDLWKYKKWLDSVEKIKKQNPANIDFTNDDIEEKSGKINFEEKSNNDNSFMSSINTDPKQMEHKVRKLIKSLIKKDRLFTSIGINEQTIKCGSSNKFKCFFKSAFRGNQNELDLQLLNDYTKYINQKLKTWQTLLHYLEDIKQRECYKIKTINPMEDTIKYRFSEKTEHANYKNKTMADDKYDDQNCKFVEFADNPNETGKQKRTKFFKLLHCKMKSNMDMRTTFKQMENRNNSVDDVRENDNHRGWPMWMSNEITATMMTDNTNQIKYEINQTKNGTNFIDKANSGKPSSVRIRRSLSDTELLSTMRSSYYTNCGRTAATTGHGTTRKIRLSTTADEKYCRCYDSSTRSSSSRRSRSSRSMSLSMGTCSRTSSSSSNYRDDDATRDHGLCSEERHECFQTAVARLEYVGSTFKEQFRLAGLKTLCKVDVLAGFGHSAEAVDLFVTALPLSKNPELMIRKAETAYDWKFFCHLSMWRHSYKD